MYIKDTLYICIHLREGWKEAGNNCYHAAQHTVIVQLATRVTSQCDSGGKGSWREERQKGRTHNGRRSRTIIDRRSNTWLGRIAATDSDWLLICIMVLYWGQPYIRRGVGPLGFGAPRRREWASRRYFGPPWVQPKVTNRSKGRDAHAVDLRRLIWRFSTIVPGEMRFYAAPWLKKCSALQSRLSVVPEKGAHRQDTERRKGAFPPLPPASQWGSHFLFSRIVDRGARSIREQDYSTLLVFSWSKTRYKSSREF